MISGLLILKDHIGAEMRDLKEWLEVDGNEDKEFFPIDCIDKRYMMNKKGLIIDSKLGRYKYPWKKNGYYYYGLMVDGKEIYIRWNTLYLMTFSPMYTTLDKYMRELGVINRGGDLDYPSLNHLIWKIPHNGVEVRFKPGYYSIPGNPGIVVNKEYSFFNLKKNVPMKIVPVKETNITNQYPVLNNNLDRKFFRQATALVHRLIMLAFKPIVGDKKNFYVNHIDGNKSNYRIENLEWTTHLDNNMHAIKTGLRKDSKSVRCTNMLTGEEMFFPSCGQCAKHFGTVAGNITHSMIQWKKFQFVKYTPWVIQFSDEPKPKVDASVLDNLSPSITVFYKLEKDGCEPELYFGITKIPKETGITRHVLANYPKRLNRELIKGYYVTTISENEISDEHKEKVIYHKKVGKAPKAIRVTDLRDSSVRDYPSTQVFADEMGMDKKSIQHTASVFDGRWKHYQIEYI